ncbi:MAG TPA: phosphonate ABC transporter, permease protein PhnE [Mycobacteriales bacterium]|jgi:phosphonate transport system permease protein|nr:phosphonate ABC transporter, permease protein PhnE [Mycobacteriales bacterium]
MPVADLLARPQPDPPAVQRRLSPPWDRRRLALRGIAVLFLVLSALAWRDIGFGVVPLFSGVGDIVRFLGDTLPPKFSEAGYPFSSMLDDAVLTVAMAVVGTAIAVVLSVPLGFLAARNTTVHPVVRFGARAVITLCRAMPDLILAIVFRDAIGIGVLPGVLALGIHSVGMLGKVYADAIEQVPQGPRDALASAGAGRLQSIFTSVLPQALPSFTSTGLYRLDINLRSSVVLGYVGAGGIGFALEKDLNTLQFRSALGIVVVMTALILLMELVSALLRGMLIGVESRRRARASVAERIAARIGRAARRAAERGGPEFDRDRVRRPLTVRRMLRMGIPLLVLTILFLSYLKTGISAAAVIHSPASVWRTVLLFFPPDFTTARSDLWSGILQSASIAVLGTAIGALIAIPVALLAARNIARRWVYRVVRVLLVVERSIPELIMAIVFVVAIGPGPVAGVFALIAGTLGFLAKLVADSLEEVDPGPRDAVRSSGAGAGQEVLTAVVPPAMPGIVGSVLYMLDINFRSSTVLGIVGGGGIGFLLNQSVQTLAYRTTGAIIILTFVIVLAIEQLAGWLRRQLL